MKDLICPQEASPKAIAFNIKRYKELINCASAEGLQIVHYAMDNMTKINGIEVFVDYELCYEPGYKVIE